jgi:hypothetical protein
MQTERAAYSKFETRKMELIMEHERFHLLMMDALDGELAA